MSGKKYLVAVDGSEWSDRAAEWAVNLAKSTGAEVHFITVVPWAKYYPLYMPEISAPVIDKADEEKKERDALLKPLMERYSNSGVSLTEELIWGHPVEVIHEQAKKEHIAMIFVGRRGRSAVADLLLGSVANSLAHTSGVPVVLVP